MILTVEAKTTVCEFIKLVLISLEKHGFFFFFNGL